MKIDQFTNEYIKLYAKKYNKKPDLKHLIDVVRSKAYKVNILKLRDVLNHFPPLNKAQPKVKNKQLKQSPPNLKNKKTSISIKKVIGCVFILIGLIFAGCSIYYTFAWMHQFQSFLLSICLSSAMILFSAFAAKVNAYTAKIKWLITLMLCITIVFSMLSTVIGQYNAKVDKENSIIVGQETETANREQFKILEDMEKTNNDELQHILHQIDSYQSFLNNFSTIEVVEKSSRMQWLFHNTKINLKTATDKAEKLRQKLIEIREEKRKLLQENKVQLKEKNTKNVYTFLNEIFKIGENNVEFIINIFPAVIIDILCPLCVFIGFFLFRKEVR